MTCPCDPATHHRLVVVVSDHHDGRGQRRDEWIAYCDLCEPGRIDLETRYRPREAPNDGGKRRRSTEAPVKATVMVLVSAMREWPRDRLSVLAVHLDADPVKIERERAFRDSGYVGVEVS